MSTTALSSEHGLLPLAPIDRPRSWFVRLLFFVLRRRYGVTPMPYRILAARSPFIGFMSLVIVTGVVKCLRIEQTLAALLQVSLAMRNGCTFCSDIGLAEATRQRIGRERFRDLLAFEGSPSFTEREQAALAYSAALSESLQIPDEVWARMARYFSERERIDIVWVCAVEHYFNSMALPLRIGSDHLADAV